MLIFKTGFFKKGFQIFQKYASKIVAPKDKKVAKWISKFYTNVSTAGQ